MEINRIFKKTALGQSEIENGQLDLSQLERRILILANGKNDLAALGKLSRHDQAAEILQALLARGLVEAVEAHAPTEPAATETPAGSTQIGAREFLCNTLQTFGNRVRVRKLVEEIMAAGDTAAVSQYVDAWYQAISESPAGMYEADNLKHKLMEMLADEAA